MKQFLLLVLTVCALSSCSGWDSESKESFKNSCIQDAKTNGMEEAAANTMCECRLQKVMAKYPGVEDALANMDKIATDPEIAACK